jgi:tetratricopeptide (TPR) repeat protein/predicted Ser/Thr protein kinase
MSGIGLRQLFEQVWDLDREARLDVYRELQADDALIRQVEALIAADQDSADPLADLVARAAERVMDRGFPDRIGPYRVLGVLGEGGMGTVLLAERADGAYEQKVAIKLIKGLVTDSALERFLRERQVLASLAHPNIAPLLDGGSTADGEPFLVMALVEGESLPEWIERAQPRLEDRLDLFLALCGAVAHAHQHLVVHRDIKPGNVRVRADGTPVLLDFGIAKLLDAGSEDPATVTRTMTPAYASPEQLLGQPITTATDIFGLGMLLYWLLAGTVPARTAGTWADATTTPAPSKTALRAPQEAIRAEARRLRGDLDKIVAQCLRPEPAMRYPSAHALAADVKAWLAGRPVQAAGDSMAYLLGRFVRRHRIATASLLLALAFAAAFAAGLVRERDRAVSAEARASQEALAANETSRFLVELFSETDPALHPGRELSARELLDLGSERLRSTTPARPEIRARLQRSLGSIYANVGEPSRAAELLETALDGGGRFLPPQERAQAFTHLANVRYHLGAFQDSLVAAQRAAAVAAALTPADDVVLGSALMTRGVAEQALAQFDLAEQSYLAAEALFQRAGAAVELTSILHNRGWLASQRGDAVASHRLYAEALERKRALLGPDHPKTLNSLQGLGSALVQLGRNEDALRVFEELLERSLRVHGPRTRPVKVVLNDLASTLQDLGRYREAQDHYERALELSRELDPGGGRMQYIELNNIGTLLEERGDVAQAERHYRRSLELRQSILPERHPARAVPAHNLARLMLSSGQPEHAREYAAPTLELRREVLGASHPVTLLTTLLWVQIALAEGDLDVARAELAAVERALEAGVELSTNGRLLLHETRALMAQAEGETASRIALLRETETALVTELPPTHPRLARQRLTLAEALLDAGEAEAAAALATAIAPILRAELVPAAPALVRLATLEQRLAGSTP